MTKTSLKQLAVGLFLMALVVHSTIPTAAEGPYNWEKTAQGQGEEKPAANRGDCDFLNNPNLFGNPRARIRELSAATELMVARMPATTVSAAPIPRKNYIDEEIFSKMERDAVAPAPLASDAEFIRRVTLDLTGRIPTAEQVRLFLADTTPDKRDRLINSLISTPEFVDRWTMWMGDLLQNNAFALNVQRYFQGRNAFHATIRQAIEQNTPYNQFVATLITSNGSNFQNGATNYIVGATTPMGPPQDTLDTAVVQMGKRFLGIDTFDCLLCHDGRGHTNALNLWATSTKRSDAWGMSAFFAHTDIRRNLVSRDPFIIESNVQDTMAREYLLNTNSGNRTPRQPVEGGSSVVRPRYIFTGEMPSPGENYRTALVRFLTNDRQFARATVNYLWEEFFGLGIVDPPTGFDLARLDPKNPPPAPWTIQPSHPELLEKLADDFIASNYDLRHIMSVIVQSNAYQLSSRYPGEWKEDFTTYFARKLVRRLDAEEIHDAIARATGIMGNYQVYGLSYNIQWAMQLPDTMEPVGYYRQPPPPEASLARVFLNTFGRGDRDDLVRSSTPSIQQGLTMMNSPFVNLRVRASATNGTVARLLSSVSDDRQLVEELFFTVLSRQASKSELEQALTMLKGNRTQGAEDLMWVLINKIDFLYNY
ncbi:MAG: DUF1553 domain-containing protein [Acidobacteriota bacterium]